MICITPITVVRPYRKMDSKYGSENAVTVPCGKCFICLVKRQKDWVFRMTKELNRSSSAAFITLTYEEPPLSPNGLMTLRSQDFTKFIKRLRHETKEKITYYSIGEYGSKYKRPHYHAIIFNLPHKLIRNSALIESIWKAGEWEGAIPGIIQVDACTAGSIGYVAGYCQHGTWIPDHCPNSGLVDDRKPHYSAMSKGIGSNYLTPAIKKYHKQNAIGYLTGPGGYLQRIPRYYKEKLFTPDELSEKLAWKKQVNLDAQEYAEFNIEKWFKSVEAEVSWKKTEIQKFEQKQKYERQSLDSERSLTRSTQAVRVL